MHEGSSLTVFGRPFVRVTTVLWLACGQPLGALWVTRNVWAAERAAVQETPTARRFVEALPLALIMMVCGTV